MLESIRSDWLNYSLSTISLVLFWLVLAWIFLFEKDKRKNNVYVYSILVSLLILGMEIVGILLLGGRSLEKIFLLLPIGILIPYGGVRMTETIRNHSKKWFAILLYAIIIQSGIGFRYAAEPLQGGMNVYKITPDVMQYAYYIKEDAEDNEVFLLAPGMIASQIQEYDVDIRVAYGPGYDFYYGNLEQLLLQMDAFGCNYLLVPMEYNDEAYVKARDYRLVVIFEGHALYARE